MTVCAPNLALEHLSKDASPCIASRDQRRDVGRLARKMVEFQHDDVRLAAVHAGVLLQERDHSKAVLGAIAHGLGKKASLLPFVIPLVVPPVCFRETVATPRLTLFLSSPHRWELVQSFGLATLRARSHDRERADSMTSREPDFAAALEYYSYTL